MQPKDKKYQRGAPLLFRFIGGGVLANSLAALLLAFAVSALFLIAFKNVFISIEEQVGSFPWILASESAPEERIAIVAIDERSIASIGAWPWSREVMADLVGKINEAGAQLQIHDILYPPGDRPNNDLLLAALAQNGKSVIAQLPVLQQQNEALRSGSLTSPVSGVSCLSGEGEAKFPVVSDFVGSSDVFASIAKGHIAPIIDADGAVRKVPALVCVQGQAYPALVWPHFFS